MPWRCSAIAVTTSHTTTASVSVTAMWEVKVKA